MPEAREMLIKLAEPPSKPSHLTGRGDADK